ncbi:MAG: hypothetical protein CL553_13100 [Alcanivorax sp.]|nr:hypothetical protein [Alcanivorax sp.]
MPMSTMTFRVEDDLKHEFSRLAKADDRSGAQLLRDFMRAYIRQKQQAADYDAWLTTKVEHSRASADAGNLVPAADVEARFAARRAVTRTNLIREEDEDFLDRRSD